MTLGTFINGLTTVALVALMLTMGLKVTLAEVVASARQSRPLVLGLFGNFLLVPLVTAGLLLVFRADPTVSIGFLILAVCPGAPVGPPLTAVARGDVAFAITLMLILAVLSAVLSPALLSAIVPWIAPDSELQINYLAIVKTLVVAQLAPLAIGLAVRHRSPRLSKRVLKLLGPISNVMLVVLMGLIIVDQFDALASIHYRAWAGMTLLLLASLAIGWHSSAQPGTRRAGAITTASRNIAVGLVIANRNFAETPAALAVVAYGLFCVLGTLGFAHRLRSDRPP